jgi:hypothetical protein
LGLLIIQYSNIVEIPKVKTTTYGKNSFKYTAAVLWNDLPDDFRKIANKLKHTYSTDKVSIYKSKKVNQAQ